MLHCGNFVERMPSQALMSLNNMRISGDSFFVKDD
jgi:hypothetical protein